MRSKRWTESSDYRQTKIWLPALNLAVSKQIVALPRKTLSTVVNLITGHNWLNYHNVKIHQEGSPLCRLCQLEDETAIHVLAECEVLWQQRARHFVYPFLSTTKPGWTLASITGFIEESSVQVFHLWEQTTLFLFIFLLLSSPRLAKPLFWSSPGSHESRIQKNWT